MFFNRLDDDYLEISHKRIECPDQSVYGNHIHNHCEMLLFIRGEADFNIDGQIFTPSPYDLLFIPAATYHYLMLRNSVPYENYVIGISPTVMEPGHYNRLFTPPLMLNVKEDEELMRFFARLDLYHKQYAVQDFFTCARALIRELVIYCSYRKSFLQSVGGGSVAYIDEIVSYIARNIERPLNAQDIARRFHLSRSYVQNLFTQNMHIGLKRYIMQKKIYAAHADLVSGAEPCRVCENTPLAITLSFTVCTKGPLAQRLRKIAKNKQKTATYGGFLLI